MAKFDSIFAVKSLNVCACPHKFGVMQLFVGGAVKSDGFLTSADA